MTIRAGDLPYGVVVEYCGEPYDIRDRDIDDEVTRVAVWLPEGVTVDAAENALKELAETRDAELIEAMARAVLDNFTDTANGYRLNATGAARDALRVVRESEAGA